MRFSRFTLRSLFVLVAICAIGLWGLSLPGLRAKKLAQLIRNGSVDS